MKYPQTTTILEGKEVCFVWMNGANFKDYSPITQCYGIVFNKNRELLLGKKTNSSTWVLPGGTPQKKETPLETLKRELLEEVDIEVMKAKRLGLQKAFEVGKEDLAVYQARFVVTDYKLLDQTPDPDGGEMWERKFFPISQVSKLLHWGETGEIMFIDALNALKDKH